MRECGSCKECCYYMEIPEYESPVREYCKHCEIDIGCNIHKDRKDVCKSFNCLWKQQEQIPEELRPDNCGVMFELPEGAITYIGYTDNEFLEIPVLTLIGKIVDAGHPVLIYRGDDGKTEYALPAGMTVEQVQEDVKNAILKHQIEG